MIKPTVGRIVWFYPDRTWKEDAMPRAAIVADVGKVVQNGVETYRLSLAVIDQGGSTYPATGVLLLQEGDPVPGAGNFCEWMPYQKGQAAKTEALEAQFAAPTAPPNDLNQRIAAKPWAKVTPEDVDMAIVGALYYVFPGTTLTVCCLKLANGFTVTGESAAAHAGNFDVKIGQELSYADAKKKVWALLGYALRERLYRTEKA